VTFTSHRCMTAFYAGSAAICKAWMQPVRKTRPEEVCRTLPRSGYTEQPRASAWLQPWVMRGAKSALPVRRSSGNMGRRRKSGGRGASLGGWRVIPPPRPSSGATFRAPPPIRLTQG
jgi:hypothetical protein